MDVTKENFQNVLPIFLQLINDQSLCYISMDCEMTGINRHGDSFYSQNDYQDSPAERYSKLRRVATYFGICQFGVSLFFDKGNHQMENASFNFEVFDQRADINVSPSAMEFLTSNGFDLNRWVTQGIACTNAEGEVKLRNQYEKKIDHMIRKEGGSPIVSSSSSSSSSSTSSLSSALPKVNEANKVVLETEEEVSAMTALFGQLDEWIEALPMAKAKQVEEFSLQEDEVEISLIKAPMLEILLGPIESPKLRKYVYQQLETLDKYNSKCDYHLNNEKRDHSYIAIMSPNQYQINESVTFLKTKLLNELEMKLGLRLIWKLIFKKCQEFKIPMIGHNCFADFCFLLHHFETLPENYLEFKTLVHELFPCIYDTKLMASQGNYNQWWATPMTSLEALMQAFAPPPPPLTSSSISGGGGTCCAGCNEYLVHSFPLPSHFTPIDALYCCSRCRLTNGKHHGGKCEQRCKDDEVILNPLTSSLNNQDVIHDKNTEDVIVDSLKSFELKCLASYDKYEKGGGYHQAGYDAYCTGLVFLRLIEGWNKHSSSSTSSSSTTTTSSSCGSVVGINLTFSRLLTMESLPINKLNLMKSPFVLTLDSIEDTYNQGDQCKLEVLKRKREDNEEDNFKKKKNDDLNNCKEMKDDEKKMFEGSHGFESMKRWMLNMVGMSNNN